MAKVSNPVQTAANIQVGSGSESFHHHNLLPQPTRVGVTFTVFPFPCGHAGSCSESYECYRRKMRDAGGLVVVKGRMDEAVYQEDGVPGVMEGGKSMEGVSYWRRTYILH